MATLSVHLFSTATGLSCAGLNSVHAMAQVEACLLQRFQIARCGEAVVAGLDEAERDIGAA